MLLLPIIRFPRRQSPVDGLDTAKCAYSTTVSLRSLLSIL